MGEGSYGEQRRPLVGRKFEVAICDLWLRLARRRDLQALARGDDGGDGGAAGFGDLAVAVAGAAADLELDEGGAAELGAVLERAALGGVEGGLGGSLTPAEQAVGAVAGGRPASGQLDLLAADAADGHPAVVAGPFFRSRDSHRCWAGEVRPAEPVSSR